MNKLSGVLALVFVVILTSTEVAGQNTRSDEVAPQYPKVAFKKEKKGFLFFSKKKQKIDYLTYREEVAAFRKRVKEAHLEHAKEEKMAEKKRYRDPAYFGHKKKPKKRPPEKQKFCKVCGIKH